MAPRGFRLRRSRCDRQPRDFNKPHGGQAPVLEVLGRRSLSERLRPKASMMASRPSSRTPDPAREDETNDRSREDEQRHGEAECDADAEARERGHGSI